jgi:2-amino-4-hydroxy-6-hydroxymethyldihydropteridine diphosphokinase
VSAGQRRTRRVWLGLGANLGDRAEQLARAIEALREAGVAVDRVSSLYDTPPWGEPPPGLAEPPRYANAVCGGETALAPAELLAVAKRIEAAAGRALDAPRNSPRPLDIDLLLIRGEVVEEPALVVPHPRLHERAFVLVPLAEVAPMARHPLLGRSAAELRDALPAEELAGVQRIEGPGWERRA